MNLSNNNLKGGSPPKGHTMNNIDLDKRYKFVGRNNHRNIILSRSFPSKHTLNEYIYLLKNTSEWLKIKNWVVVDIVEEKIIKDVCRSFESPYVK